MQLKRPEMMSHQWFFDWDYARSLDQDSFKNAWEGVAIPLIAVAFAAAFRSLVARCKKRVCLGGKFVEKS